MTIGEVLGRSMERRRYVRAVARLEALAIRRYKVTTSRGRHYFGTLEAAKAACENVFRETGIILGIEPATEAEQFEYLARVAARMGRA